MAGIFRVWDQPFDPPPLDLVRRPRSLIFGLDSRAGARAARRSVLDPYAKCRSNHDVVCGLAGRLGARHPGFAMSAIELIEQTLRISGLPDRESFSEGGWLDCCPPFETSHFIDGFAHSDGKFHFRAD